ncbi:exosortase/archaeosortase family protein [bacterium]|nr:exosortase/archaeosortase family protein [bacterium]
MADSAPTAWHRAAVAASGLALGWVFWPTLQAVADRWADDPRYSHGYLVPLFSAYLLWARRGRLAGSPDHRHWLGFPLLAAGLAARGAGVTFHVEWAAAAALLPCLAGLALLWGGRRGLAWAGPAIAFLVFMVPLPYRVEVALAHPLQRVATAASTYALQTLGVLAVAEGNTIRLGGGIRLGVVEACSGLSMLVVFFALATAAAVVVRRPVYERLLLVASAVPIALAANVARITVTGVLHKTAGSEIADRVFHDLAGWLMMPLALVLMWAELAVLGRLIVDTSAPLPARADRPAATPGS